MQPILVTGGAGFIGAQLVRRLHAEGHRIAILCRKTTDCSRLKDLLPHLERIDGDLENLESIKRCIDQVQPRGIFHLAASTVRSGVTASAEEVVRTNVLGTANLLEAARAIPYEFFVSTGSYLEYGTKESPMREDDQCDPLELYSATKLAATLLIQTEARNHEKPTLVLRIFNPYGPGMEPKRLIREMITRSLANEPILMSDPDTKRDFVFVSDIVDLLLEISKKAESLKGQIFNLGSGTSVSLRELAEVVLKETGSTSEIRWRAFPRVIYDAAVCSADMRKTFAAFAWRPLHDITSGITETTSWLRSVLTHA